MTAAPAPARRSLPHRLVRALPRRWPSALGALAAVVILGGDDAATLTRSLGETLLFLPLIYLVAARSGRRWLAWPALGATFAVSFAAQALDLPVAAVTVPLAVAALAWSAFGHTGTVRAQALGMLGFGAVALASLAVDTDLAVYLVAAGWLFHGAWDLVHLRLDRAVARSYAEWCGVLDVLIAAWLLVLA